MNEYLAAFTIVNGVLLLTLPRRLAPIPLLLVAAYAPHEAAVEIGAAHFTADRLVIAAGMVRLLVKREGLAHGVNAVDRMMVLWAAVLLATSAFHTTGALMYRAGLVWTQLGSYFLFRSFLRTTDDVEGIFKVLCIALLPLALLMLLEKSQGYNYFAIFGADSGVDVREGHARASGPFGHSILAGTVGAGCFPVGLYFLKRRPLLALAGMVSAGGILFAATSSGPTMMLLFTMLAMLLWNARQALPALRWLALAGVIALDIIMHDPVYFLMARIDITGGSTGYFRAQLIRSSIEHLDEWWLTGTDHTRHWMLSGITANANQTDITNHYLAMGVMGGLPLMIIFMLVLVYAFRIAGRALKAGDAASPKPYLVWTVGAILFGHAANFLAISLFDQSVVFFNFILAAFGAFPGVRTPARRPLSAPSMRSRGVPRGTASATNALARGEKGTRHAEARR